MNNITDILQRSIDKLEYGHVTTIDVEYLKQAIQYIKELEGNIDQMDHENRLKAHQVVNKVTSICNELKKYKNTIESIREELSYHVCGEKTPNSSIRKILADNQV